MTNPLINFRAPKRDPIIEQATMIHRRLLHVFNNIPNDILQPHTKHMTNTKVYLTSPLHEDNRAYLLSNNFVIDSEQKIGDWHILQISW